jgi:hypothetical protein
MLAAIFGRQGFFLAHDADSELRRPDRANPHGYWEAESLIERNVEVFAATGFPHHNTWLFDAISPAQADRIRHLDPLPGHRGFLSQYACHTPWVWKDPRLCYTLSYWWPLVDPMTTRVLLIKRNPESTYRSFIRLKWRVDTDESRADVFRRIKDHNRAARDAIVSLNIPHMELEYDRFKEEGDTIARELGDFIGVELEPAALGFDQRHDHSEGAGRAVFAAERLAERMPAWLRRAARVGMPSSIMRRLFPGE